jgi:ADP-heptose:LPS heptosyltransferase
MKKTRIAIKTESSLEALLSSAPIVSTIKKKFPNSEVGLLTENCFAEATALIPELDFHLQDFSEQEDMELVDLSNSAIYGIGTESIDWKSYLQGCSSQDFNNPYHYIDLLKKAAGFDLEEVNYELRSNVIEHSDSILNIQNDLNLKIGICLSTVDVEEARACLEGLSLLQSPITIYFLGTISQKRSSNILLSNFSDSLNIIDLCGRQSVLETAETLRLLDISICGSGTNALLSSGYGTFTICIDKNQNPLHYPYGHGHLIFQKSGSEQFNKALSGLVFESLNFAIHGNNGTIPSVDQWQEFADSLIDNYLGHVRFFITQRIETLLPNGSAFTELYLRPLLFLGAEISDIFKTFYRLLWENSLNHRDLQSKELDILHHGSLPHLAEYLKPMEQAYELANFGCIYSSYIQKSLTEGNIGRAKHESAKLQETETLLFTLGRTYPGIAALCAFHEKRQQLIPVAEPIELAIQMHEQFEHLKQRILVLLDLANSLFHTSLQSERALMQRAQEDLSNG